MKKIILILLIISSNYIFSQSEKPAVTFNLTGFIKTDAFYDTRQTITLREGHFLLYPENESFDKNGIDINKNGSFNILSIQTRLNGKITGPDAFGAATSGVIEGEFFGTSDGDVNGFRLRHAYLRLDWEKLSLLAGQMWHPMFITEMFPGVVSFNTGVPFQPFSRNPQIKFIYSPVKDLKIIGAVISQRDFTSNGPSGLSSIYMRNAVIPNLHGQLQFSTGSHLFGAGIDYKKLRPQLRTSKNVSTDASVSSMAFMGYAKLNLGPVLLKSEAVYGGNLADHVMLGGYAIKSLDTTTMAAEYTPVNILSVWGELSYGKDVELAVFGGYTKNLGANDNTAGFYYGRGTNIDNVLRISPRIQYNSGKTRISAELEYTSAGYGSNDNSNKGKIINIKNIVNIRSLLSFIYFF